MLLEHGQNKSEVELTQMDLLDTHRMLSLRDRMIAKYVPIRERSSEFDGEPVDFPPVGGQPVTLNEETCEACATLAVMQSTFSFEALVALALTAPVLFEALMAAAGRLNRGKDQTASTCASQDSPAVLA